MELYAIWNKSEIINRILEFSEEKQGDWIAFDEIDKAIKLVAFESPENWSKFANDLEDISKWWRPSPLDIVEIISENKMNVDSFKVISYLFQDSSNPSFIWKSSISKFAKYIQSWVSDSQINRNWKLNKNTKDLITKLMKKTWNKSHKDYKNISETAKSLFIRLADFIYENQTSLFKLIHQIIFSKMIDGIEYQLVKKEYLYQTLEHAGFELNQTDREAFEHLISPILRDNINIDSIRHYLNLLGVDESLPEQNAYLNFSTLKGPAIRIFNRIIKFINEHKLNSIEELIGQDNIEEYNVESKCK